MLTALKFHGCTVHLFRIDGRSYYVTRMDFFAASLWARSGSPLLHRRA